MELKDIIYKRKSIRKYKKELVNEETLCLIKDFIANVKPLFKDIKVRFEITSKDNVKCILPWITQQVITVFSETKEGYLENVGFMLQQVDLYLQTLGLGACWLGLGKLNTKAKSQINDNLEFVMMMAFGYPKEELHRELSDFKRKSLEKISDMIDERLEPARLAPSSINSQPWYFTHEGNIINVYCDKGGIFTFKTLSNMHIIDVGIALAHIYICNEETFKYFKLDNYKEIKGYRYIGSFTI